MPFDTNLKKVCKIFRRIGRDLVANRVSAPALILPFKNKGVCRMNDMGLVVSGKLVFRPELSQQYPIQREIHRRVQNDFAAAGIAFARREIRATVDGEAAPARGAALGGAAAAAVPDSLRSPGIADLVDPGGPR